MTARPPGSTVWGLTAEPFDDDVAWSLVRHDDAGTVALEAGIIEGVAAATLVQLQALTPTGSESWGDVHLQPLTDPAREAQLAERLGQTLLPPALRRALTAEPHPRPGEPVRHAIHLAVRGWLSGLPWEAFVVDPASGARLVERALVVARMSPALWSSRSVATRPVPVDAPGLAVVDPGPPLGPDQPFAPVYPGSVPHLLTGAQGIAVTDSLEPDPFQPEPLGRDRLAELLGRQWSRLLYVGHVRAGAPHDPAAAGLVLQQRGEPDVLTAADWLAEPTRWPVPPRVAIIGCGSDDSLFTEVSGLPAALVNAGAELVTATRWPLPTDAAGGDGSEPTSELALAVHRAHRSPYPLDVLRDWQLWRLHRWRTSGLLADSPLWWASLTSYVTDLPTSGQERGVA